MKLTNSSRQALTLVDTGACVSVMPRNLYYSIDESHRGPLEANGIRLQAGNGTEVTTFGEAEVTFQLNGKEYKHIFNVCSDDSGLVLGVDFIRDRDLVIQPGNHVMMLDAHSIPTVDVKGLVLHHRVALTTTVHLRPGEQKLLVGNVVGKVNVDGRAVVIEPANAVYGKTGAVVCKIAAVPRARAVPLRIANPGEDTVTIYRGTTVGILSDLTETTDWGTVECKTPRGRPRTTTDVVKQECEEAARISEVHAELEDDDALPEQVQQLYCDSSKDLPESQRKTLRDLLREYSSIFARHSADFGRTHLLKHDIDTGNEPPVKQRPRRFPRQSADELKRQITGMAEKNIIRPSMSSWASNALLVKKKDGSYRMCIDYRELNAKTRNLDEYMLPRIDDTIDALSRAKFFCTLDLIQGYHQVELEEAAKPKTAFIAPQCNPSQWEFNYMPFGLKGAPRTFQRMMDRLLHGLDYRIAMAYLDDVIVYGATIDECLVNLRLVFERIAQANLKLKPKKCSLFQRETLYLGHIISGDGVRCDPDKVKAVKEWTAPRNLRQVRSFVGLVNYYRRFIRNYADLAIPLYDLQKKKTRFHWGADEQKSFEKLKLALISAPVMAFPQAEGRYILDTDASGYGIGGVLSQLQKDENGVEQERVIAYASRRLQGREQRYCARKRELLAIVHFVKHFDVYLRGPPITIRTDHASLRYIKTLKELPDQFARWIMTLENYHYTIEIRKGALHTNADTLSRYVCCEGKQCMCTDVAKLEETTKDLVDTFDPENPDSISAANISAIRFTPEFPPDEMAKAQEDDADIGPLYRAKEQHQERPPYSEVSGGSPALKAYWAEWKRLELHDGLLYRRWENDVGDTQRLQLIVPFRYQKEISKSLHGPAGAAHLGRRRTHEFISRRMFWYRMADDIKFWIKVCDKCQRRKRPGITPQAPMKLYQSGYCNERVQMDICGPVNESRHGNIYLLVLTDRFSKYTKAFPLPNKETKTVAECVVTRWIHEYGEPEQIHTDQGGEFESHLMRDLLKLYGIHKSRTTPYHPEGNAQVERYNQTIAMMLSVLATDYKDWDMKIPLAVSSYNGTIHATTSFTPNKLWFGRELYVQADRVIPDNPLKKRTTREQYVERLELDMRIAYEVARNVIGRNMKVQKRYHDRNAHLNAYKVGEAVMKKSLPPKEKGTKKFAARWEGPLFVIDVLDDVTYRVGEQNKKTWVVIHHDRLKRYHYEPGIDIPNGWVWSATKTRTKLPGKEVATQYEIPREKPQRVTLADCPARFELTTAERDALLEESYYLETVEILELRKLMATLVDSVRVHGEPHCGVQEIKDYVRPRGRPPLSKSKPNKKSQVKHTTEEQQETATARARPQRTRKAPGRFQD